MGGRCAVLSVILSYGMLGCVCGCVCECSGAVVVVLYSLISGHGSRIFFSVSAHGLVHMLPPLKYHFNRRVGDPKVF